MGPHVTNLVYLVFAILLAGGAAPAQVLSTPHLKGTWMGKATANICGASALPVDVELVLKDHGYKPTGAIAAGNVSGMLAINGVLSGLIVARYQAPQLKADLLSMQAPQIYGNKNDRFAPYDFEFTAKDPTAGVGYYQTLSGTLTRQHPDCPDRGAKGEMLTVDLKKQ